MDSTGRPRVRSRDRRLAGETEAAIREELKGVQPVTKGQPDDLLESRLPGE
jgi:hypothetical protein